MPPRRPRGHPGVRVARPHRLRDLLIALLSVAMLLAAPLILFQFWSGPFIDRTCAPAGQRKLAAQAKVVRDRLPDATDFEVQTYDCDCGGSAFLSFRSGMAPAAARAAFLSDPRCQPTNDVDAAVLCDTGSKPYYLSFGSGPTTAGSLSWAT